MTFERTVCGCVECVQCCRDQPASLAPGDFERIRDHLGITDTLAKLYFWASPGALVMDADTKVPYAIGTITPKRAHGKCVFLQRGRCTIHEVAPFGCAYFDTHMSRKEGQTRGIYHLLEIARSASYQQLRSELPPARSHKPRWA